MSHHLDPPVAREDARVDITDHYVFDADGATVLVMNVSTSLGGDPRRDPFHPRARYELKVHLDDHDREAVTYRWAFDPADGDEQDYHVERLTGDEAGSDTAIGTVIARGRTGEHVTTQDGGQTWAGQALDTFFVDRGQLRDVDRLVQRGQHIDLTRWARGVAEDSFTGATVRSIVLTVGIGVDGLSTGRRIGTWATTKLPTAAGGWRQVGRAGLPLVWPIFRPGDGDGSARLHQTHPADDPARFGPGIADLVSSAVELLGTSERPDGYADSVVERIVPDLLPYIVGSPAVFGFGRFNGRRLADNAAEVMFSLATNSAVPTGLRGTDARRSQQAFPFVVPAGDQRLDEGHRL